MILKRYPKKCTCGVTIDNKKDYLYHDCNYWEWVLEEEKEKNEKI